MKKIFYLSIIGSGICLLTACQGNLENVNPGVPATTNNTSPTTTNNRGGGGNTTPSSCPAPAGTTAIGMVMLKYADNNFLFQVNGVNYTVLANFFGGTEVINLNCALCPMQFIQVGNFVRVTGDYSTAFIYGSATLKPVIYAKQVQVQTTKDH